MACYFSVFTVDINEWCNAKTNRKINFDCNENVEKVTTVNRSRGELILGAIAIAILFVSFLRLGMWQLDRAEELKKLQTPQPEKPIVALLDVAQPGTNLSGNSVNRRVHLHGHYVASYRAPGQISPTQQRETWSIGLLEIPDVGAILIAREIIPADSTPEQVPEGDVEVIGRLMPRQYDDRSEPSPGVLSRIDSALIIRDTDLALFDGFVLAQSEKIDGKKSPLRYIKDSQAKPTIPGFYWQHIAYVAIWWLAAVVVLFLPFYQRFHERSRNG